MVSRSRQEIFDQRKMGDRTAGTDLLAIPAADISTSLERRLNIVLAVFNGPWRRTLTAMEGRSPS